MGSSFARSQQARPTTPCLRSRTPCLWRSLCPPMSPVGRVWEIYRRPGPLCRLSQLRMSRCLRSLFMTTVHSNEASELLTWMISRSCDAQLGMFFRGGLWVLSGGLCSVAARSDELAEYHNRRPHLKSLGSRSNIISCSAPLHVLSMCMRIEKK